jgi:Family of unknown function (DUF5681)
MANPNWKKGVSGNPGGRPRGVAEVRALAMTFTAEAIETLAAIMRNVKAPPQARAAAANALLDRGVGKPEISAKVEKTTIEKVGPELDLSRLKDTDWQLLEALRPVLERARVNKETEH